MYITNSGEVSGDDGYLFLETSKAIDISRQSCLWFWFRLLEHAELMVAINNDENPDQYGETVWNDGDAWSAEGGMLPLSLLGGLHFNKVCCPFYSS